MPTLVCQNAPQFKADAVMPDGSFQEISLSDFKGKYVLLFFYPLDFTFVCPSEILAFNEKVKELQSKNVQLIGVSVDSKFSHAAWTRTPLDKGGIGKIGFPLVSDLSKQISKDYGVLLDAGIALRGLFLIDKNGVVRCETVHDLPLGRSVEESIRVVDALQFTEQYGEVCPANWKKGDKAMKASDEGVADYLKSTF